MVQFVVMNSQAAYLIVTDCKVRPLSKHIAPISVYLASI